MTKHDDVASKFCIVTPEEPVLLEHSDESRVQGGERRGSASWLVPDQSQLLIRVVSA